MNEHSPLLYRLTLYATFLAGILLGLYGSWVPSTLLLLIAMIMQWRRSLPSKFEWTRWTTVIGIALMIAIDIYGMLDPQVSSVFGQ